MDQFNRDLYKKETLFQQFYHSCLGKIIILLGAGLALFVIALVTTPTEEQMAVYTEDNIHECLQDNEELRSDHLDEVFNNIGRTFSIADTTRTNKEVYDTYKRLNTIKVYPHAAYMTSYLHSSAHPEGIRVGIGVFGLVISTVRYDDILLDVGTVRGHYYEEHIKMQNIPEDLGDNPVLKPYHYKGDPDN